MECAVVIPVYKSSPSFDEELSFRQCLKILNDHDIFIVTYKELDCSAYFRISNEFNCKFQKKEFDKSYFSSIDGYNKLCLSSSFYNTFIDYEYMLIYQLDAWVFRDELVYWCEKGYDYIGAPWFYTNNQEKDNYRMKDVPGNGGFSLRRIKFCLEILNHAGMLPLVTPLGILKSFDGFWKNLWKILPRFLGFKNTKKYYLSGKVGEDTIFASQKYSYKNHFKFPSPIEASYFSFEKNPSYLYRINNGKLPFGCHAYRKYEYETFWKNYIY